MIHAYKNLVPMPVWPAMLIVAEGEYLLGTMLTGIPKECLINVWLGTLHRLVHIPIQSVSSKNLQGVDLMAKYQEQWKLQWWFDNFHCDGHDGNGEGENLEATKQIDLGKKVSTYMR